MTSEKSTADRRRFPRIFLPRDVEETPRILGLKVHWPDGIVGGVYDISYSGAALSRPRTFTDHLARGDRFDLKIQFPSSPESSAAFKVNDQEMMARARFVRASETVVAIHFEDVSADLRLCIERFLQTKLLGIHTRCISPEVYSTIEGFDFWFHGPKDTNIFMWLREGRIHRATIELDYRILFLDEGVLTQGESRPELSSLTEDYSYYITFEAPHFEMTSGTSILDRAVEVLSQIEDRKDLIQELLEEIKKARSA